jgi:hypothetical protein
MIKNDENHGKLKYFKSKILLLGKFQCILHLNSSFEGGLVFNFYFETIMTYFMSSHFLYHV